LQRNLKTKPVKRIIRSIAFIALALLSIPVIAGKTPSSTDASIKKEITRTMGYPEALTSQHEIELVLVSFEVQPCGLISILETNASNKEFENYVLRKLRAMHIESTDGAVMNMKFTFTSKG
jgi:hypothetical protein